MATTMGTLGGILLRRYDVLGEPRTGRPLEASIKRGHRKSMPQDLLAVEEAHAAQRHSLREKARQQTVSQFLPDVEGLKRSKAVPRQFKGTAHLSRT